MVNNEITKNSRSLPTWMNELVNMLSKKEVISENENIEDIKTAEINIKDLDTIVWNDETFYVNFDEFGATILNGFGNTVTTLEDAKTLDDVNNALNGKQITTNKLSNTMEIDAEIENEINKAMAYVENDIDDTDEKDTMTKEEILSFLNDKIKEIKDDLTNEFNTKLAAIEQQYARNTEIINDEDISREIDVQRMEEAEKITKEQIQKDNLIDRTTIDGKYSKENLLPDEEIEQFKEGKCPYCGSQLLKDSIDGDYINIICSEDDCNSKFVIDSNTENIYIQ